ncbi:MAG TPA: LssY C-terminal domain-containing protein [Gammaproteobacteria bacterium]|jgi:hypothetical protein|nr:LssY C-terminal domain-containing protein [Gammaproteobacteria bacterium]
MHAATASERVRFIVHVSWRVILIAVICVAIYGVCAYAIAPRLWRHYEHNPGLAGLAKTTTTAAGIPADPLNVGFTGTQDELVRALIAADWSPADPITLRTSLGIVTSVLLRRADPTAPVSSLYLLGRKQDLAFEREAGRSARQRHHVRIWKSSERSKDGRPFWIGAATFDRGVGLSHDTGQITHHIAPDIDHERAILIANVQHTGQVLRVYQVTGVGPTLIGRNGSGDWYYTDGELSVAVLAVNNAGQRHAPLRLKNPPAVTLKNRIWKWLRAILPN